MKFFDDSHKVTRVTQELIKAKSYSGQEEKIVEVLKNIFLNSVLPIIMWMNMAILSEGLRGNYRAKKFYSMPI